MSGKQVVAGRGDGRRRCGPPSRPGSDPDFVLIARTDARAVEGLDAALERAAAYREAGADVLFVEAPQSEDEIVAVAEAFPDVPLLFNWVERGMTPMLPLERIAELGFALVLFPVATLFSATAGMQRYLGELRRTGTPLGALDDATPFDDFTDLVHLPEVRAFEAASPAPETTEAAARISGRRPSCSRVELRGLEPLTPTLPVWCATSCATAPRRAVSTLQGLRLGRGDRTAEDLRGDGSGHPDQRREAGVVPLQAPAPLGLDQDGPAGVAQRCQAAPVDVGQLQQDADRGLGRPAVRDGQQRAARGTAARWSSRQAAARSPASR